MKVFEDETINDKANLYSSPSLNILNSQIRILLID